MYIGLFEGGREAQSFTPLYWSAAADLDKGLCLSRKGLDAGRLVVPFQHSYRTAKAYHLVLPERKVEDPSLSAFSDWLVAEVTAFKGTAAL